jgi:hypothetical protein
MPDANSLQFLFCLRRKKSKPDTVTKGAYMQGNTSDQWMGE